MKGEAIIFWGLLILSAALLLSNCAPRQDWGALSRAIGEVQRRDK